MLLALLVAGFSTACGESYPFTIEWDLPGPSMPGDGPSDAPRGDVEGEAAQEDAVDGAPGTDEVQRDEEAAEPAADPLAGGGGSDWANQPAGFATLTDQPWVTLGSQGWNHQNRASVSRIVQDRTAPSGGPVLEHFFPRGFTNHGAEPAIDYINLRGETEIFVGMWFKASGSWHGHSSRVNKIAFAWSGDHRSNIVFTMYGPDGGPYHFMPVFQGQPDTRKQYLDQNVQRVSMTPGKWHRLEIHLAVRSSGRGVLRWYQDGTLLGELTDVSFNPTGFGEFQIAPTWGGTGGPDKSRDDYFRYDRVHIGAPAR